VRQKQAQTHSWSIDHLTKSIHAIGKNACKGSARVADDGTLEPCTACMSLLSMQAFRNAISREPGESKNRASVPHVYQPPEIGRLYSLGLQNLIEGVRPSVAAGSSWCFRKNAIAPSINSIKLRKYLSG
jgi:hypothetical protein